MIETLRLQNFRSHADTTVEFGRLTVLVGANGSGKSSVLEALGLVCALARQPRASAWDAVAVRSRPQFSGRAGAGHMSVSAQAGEYRASLTGQLGRGQWNTDAIYTRDKATLTPGDDFPKAIQVALRGDRLAEPVEMDLDAELEQDGRGLAAVLTLIKLRDSKRFAAIVDDLRVIVPGVEDIRVDVGEGLKYQVALDINGMAALPAHALSEGTLIALGLVTALRNRSGVSVLLIDDIDHALHPKAQWELVGLLRRMLAADPDLQIVATTHSPYLVDVLEPHEVRVCALDSKGVSHCRSLADHPKARLLDVLTTGEFLGAEGEDWVAAGA